MPYFLLPGFASLVYKELAEEVTQFRNQTLAASTRHTYSTHRDTYLQFCFYMNLPSVPATSSTICLYAPFLARSLKFSSIKQHLSIIGLLHKEFGLPNPLLDNWHLSSLLTGVKRVMGNAPMQKLPITLDILRGIFGRLNLNYSVDASFWAICLVAFFGMFRKSHPLSTTSSSFDPVRQFTKADFRFFPWGVLIRVRWSKTIQFREKEVFVPLPRVPGSPFCPVSAIYRAFAFTSMASDSSQAFLWLHPSLKF